MVGDEIRLIISTKVNASNNTLNLKANVSADTFDSIPSNNYDLDSVNALPLCDLITKVSVSDEDANKDDVVDWIVVVSNEGPDSASDVSLSLSDFESLGLIVLDSSDDSFDEDACEWFIGDLGPGESATLTITTQVNKSNDNISIVGEAETSTMESDYENNIDNESLEVLPLCDLVISISPDNNPVNVGETVNWIINVTNNGPDEASDVNVANSLPDGLELIAHDSNKGDLEEITDEDGNIIDLIWKVGDLESNESALLILSTNASKEGTILNNVSVNSSAPDINESNNFDSSEIEVIPSDDDSNQDDNPNDSSDNTDENNDSESYEDDDEDYPWYDYYLDGDNNNSDKKLNDNAYDKSKKNYGDNSKMSNTNDDLKPIDLSSKKTGNPLVFVVLSIFALFLLDYRKN